MLAITLLIVWATGAICTAVSLGVQLSILAARNPKARVSTSPARIIWQSLTWPPRVLWAGVTAVFDGV